MKVYVIVGKRLDAYLDEDGNTREATWIAGIKLSKEKALLFAVNKVIESRERGEEDLFDVEEHCAD